MIIFEILCAFVNMSLCCDTLVVNEFKDSINLQYAVYDNSLLVMSQDRILEKKRDYDFSGGIILFPESLSTPITIIFEKTNYTIPYSFRKFSKSRGEEPLKTAEESKKESNVSISGAKSFLISSQSGNVFMDQSLDVSIAGNISNEWSVEGKIYDNTSDINSTSINSPLSQFEDIYISMNGNKKSIILGSSSFKGFSNEMSRFSREIFGITASMESFKIPFSASLAGQKGRFSTESFYCLANTQGPYKLTDNSEISMYVISPESEKIYLNGELLKSGEENDYTINYFTGEITFTVRRIVDDRSYVYAEFQTYEELSPVTGYFFKAGKDTSGFSVLYSHEEQSVLNSEAETMLKNIPSDSSTFIVNGYSFVGGGNGDYILEDSIFVFTGAGNGDYIIDFYYVGYGKGDYAYSPVSGCYIYAGAFNGNYSVYKTISLPFSSDYLSLSHSQKTFFGDFIIEASNGFFMSNRYSLDNEKTSGMSYKAKYSSREISIGKINFDFSVEKSSRSDIYRSSWSSSSTGDEALYNALNSIYPEKETKFAERMHFENLFTLKGYYGFLDSVNDAYFNISSDTLFDFFSSLEKRLTFVSDSSSYDLRVLTAGRRFQTLIAYLYASDEDKNMEISSRKGGVILMKNFPLRGEYFFEERLSDSVKKYRANKIKAEFSKSWEIISASLVSEYGRVEDIAALSASNRFSLYSSLGIAAGQNLNSNSSLRITSLSTYVDRDAYVFVGEGKGDYVYDEQTDSYIYDAIYGSFIKITERSLSDDPVSSRNFSSDIASSFSRVDLSCGLSYNDMAKNFFDFDSASFVSKSIASYLSSSFSVMENLDIFDDFSYADNFMENISSSGSLKNEAGLKSDKEPFLYSLSFLFQTEEQRFSSGEYYLKSLMGKGMINPKQGKSSYNIELSFGKFFGMYSFLSNEETLIEGRSISLSAQTSFPIKNRFSSLISPVFSYNEYIRGNSDPLLIHYKYPEGFALNFTLSLIYSSDFLNLKASYISDFDKRYGFRQRTEVSLFSYF